MKMRRRRAVSAALVTALLTTPLFALSGCSWRLETPDPPLPVPDQTERIRDSAARAEADIIESLTHSNPGGPGGEWLLAFEDSAAAAHLDALGGVYRPFPNPSPVPSPSASSHLGLGPTSFSRYVAFAQDIALNGALIAEDPDLVQLLASIGLSHAAALRVQSEEDARAARIVVPEIADRVAPLPSDVLDAIWTATPTVAVPEVGAPTIVAPMIVAPLNVVPPAPTSTDLVPSSTSVSQETLLDLILLHDYAVYLCDVVAARASGDLRFVAYDRSFIHQNRADALITLVGSDPRGPSYVIDRERLDSNEDMEALLAQVEGDLATLYLRALGEVVEGDGDSVAERAWLLSGAFDALVASWLRLPRPEEASAFPGASVPGYSPVEPPPLPSPSPSTV